MPVWGEIENSRSRLVRLLHDWWMARRRPEGMPYRSDVDPAELKPVLPNLFIAEAEHDPFRIRYRLVGTRAVAITGYDITGRYLDELLNPDETDAPWLRFYRRVYDTRMPLLGSVTVPAQSGGSFDYEFGLFPLTHPSSNPGGHPGGGDTVRVEQFIAVEDYFDIPLRSALLKPWQPR
jgi:hypothetical protein